MKHTKYILTYILAGLIFLGGVYSGMVDFLEGVMTVHNITYVFSGPGEIQVDLDEPGQYIIYEILEEGDMASELARDLEFEVRDVSADKILVNRSVADDLVYEPTEERVVSLRSFDLSQPTRIDIRALARSDSDEDIRLMLGTDYGQDSLELIFKSFMTFLGWLLLATGLGLVTLVLHLKAVKKYRLSIKVDEIVAQ